MKNKLSDETMIELINNIDDLKGDMTEFLIFSANRVQNMRECLSNLSDRIGSIYLASNKKVKK